MALALMVAGHAGEAAPRLLILGDSLSAGYGLPHDEGFESSLRAALQAHGIDTNPFVVLQIERFALVDLLIDEIRSL